MMQRRTNEQLARLNKPKITVNQSDTLPHIHYECIETVADMTTKTSKFVVSGNSLDECWQVISLCKELSEGKLEIEEDDEKETTENE